MAEEKKDDPAQSAYFNARTCICGRDARYHKAHKCEGFDPGWDELRRSHTRLTRENEELRGALRASSHALRSYQYGNASPDLAEGVADKIDALLTPTPGATDD